MSTSTEQDPAENGMLPETITLPESSLTSLPPESVIVTQMEASVDLFGNSKAEEELESFSSSSHRESIVNDDRSSLVFRYLNELSGDEDATKTSQRNEFDIFEGNLTKIEALSTTGGRISPCSSSDSSTSDRSRPGQGNSCNQNHNGPFEIQPGLPNPPTPISQISAIAAEVADIAAILDASPVEAVTPELPSGAYSGSPIVELVEKPSFSSISDASRIAAEVVDTAEMLDYSPGGLFVIGPGAYATEQSPEEVHMGAIRMVQITNTDDSQTEIRRFVNAEGEGSPGECSSKVAIIAEEKNKADAVLEEAQNISAVEEEKLIDGNCNLKTGSTGSVPSTPPGYEYYSSLQKDKEFDAIKGQPSTNSEKDTRHQKETLGLIPPHLRRNLEPSFHPDVSDLESSMLGAVSDLNTDRLNKDSFPSNFISSIRTEDLVDIVSDAYAESYDTEISMINCTVGPNPRVGSKNVFYIAEFSNKQNTRKHKWVIRIPLQGHGFDNAEKAWLDSDIRAMEFIKERTDIPIPYIYGYNNGTKNKIRSPYVLMDFMEGDRVEDVWENWNEEKRTRCLSQCAESMRKLGRFGFKSIGVLGCDYRKGEYVVHGVPSDTKGKGLLLAGPFQSTAAYLDNTWRGKVRELDDSPRPGAIKNKQFLILLKLLFPALVDTGSKTEHFFLSLPKFRGENVLVDCDGNITGFVGWEKVMTMPKAMGYARYPEWVIKDWISPQEISQPIAQQRGRETTKAKTSPKINHKSLTKASLGTGKTIETVKDSEGVIRGYLLEEGQKIPEPKSLASLPQPRVLENEDSTEELNSCPPVIQTGEDGTTDTPKITFSEALVTPTDYQLPEGPPANGHQKINKKGRSENNKNIREGNRRINRGNRRGQDHNYNESIEFQRAITDEDKTKVHAVSRWNTLPGEITQKEAEEREERKQARLAKEKEEEIAGVKKETPMLPKVLETFKKVAVEQNLGRKLLEVVKTERKDPLDGKNDIEDTKAVSLPKLTGLARYREIYHGFFMKIAPEDRMETRFSYISTAVHIAVIDDDLRPSIVPRLARHVFGTAVGPSLLGMVGNGQWAEELLAKIAEEKDEPRKGVRFRGEDEQSGVEDGIVKGDKRIGVLILFGPIAFVGFVVIIIAASLAIAWTLDLGEYNLKFSWNGNRCAIVAKLNLYLPTALAQPPNYETVRATAHFLADLLWGTAGAINFALTYSLTFVVAAVLFVALLTMQGHVRF